MKPEIRMFKAARLRLLLIALFVAPTAWTQTALAQTPPQTSPASTTEGSAPAAMKPHSWEAEIARFEAADKKSPPPQNAVLFIGSSSILKWRTVAKDFPDVPTINRGFGGSSVADSTYFADRIVVPYHPRRIVFYAGDNDLAAGHSPEQVLEDTEGFVAKVRSALPDVPILLISIKPSPSRMKFADKQVKANNLLAEFCAKSKNVTFVDVATSMLGADGQPIPDLFGPDRLHMTPKGYALWTKILTPHVK